MNLTGQFPTIRCLALLSAISLMAGCNFGPKLVPVTGSVTVKGKPAEGAVILLHPENEELTTASGVADAQGAFKLVSGPDSPGVRTGKYKVTITWPDPAIKPTPAQLMQGLFEPGPDLLKGKYATKAKTSLSVEITPDTTALPPYEL
ncbi:MAG: carboxypeptidase regulatory-like domain-containing protein [Pirellulaceae bacterium]|nr:carboxypeptidase regulatory-like domain-containing protein [Planctomycetales bacterium]MCC7338632.1 carboxypeptidase regulatory-like domain-containing protein [Pirellulaceae bacterium]